MFVRVFFLTFCCFIGWSWAHNDYGELSTRNITITMHGTPKYIVNFLKEFRESEAILNKVQVQEGKGSCQICQKSFYLVGGLGCICIDPSVKVNWNDARVFCQRKGADLVVWKDANAFAELLQYVKATGKRITYWIGGTDREHEGKWLWVNGKPMTMGSPYWGTYGDSNTMEPSGGKTQNCADLWHTNKFYTHDAACKTKLVPICQQANTVP